MTSIELRALIGRLRRALAKLPQGSPWDELFLELQAAENAVADIATMLTRDEAYAAAQHHPGLVEELLEAREQDVAAGILARAGRLLLDTTPPPGSEADHG